MTDMPNDVIPEGYVPPEIPRLSFAQIIKTLDIAVLKPDARLEDVTIAARFVEDAGAASVCVASCNVALAKTITPRVCSVVGFPHGTTRDFIKYAEARAAIEDGAVEVDVVINYGHFLEGRKVAVTQELGQIVQLAHKANAKVKAILETCYYHPRQIIAACELCVDVGVDWVKTSTGFGPSGATPWAVQLMVETVKDAAGVKASGGIKTYEDACLYLALGCTRLGVGATSYKGLLPSTPS
jgi:deoxyribose-phosphate aldolase